MRLVAVLLVGSLLGALALALADDVPAPAAPTGTAAPASPAPAPAPRITFEAKEVDFGKVVVGAVVEKIFRFKNTGTADLLVRRVKPSCGCTAALLSKGDLEPGEAGEIQARFESGDRQGFQNIEIHVFSNDPQERDMGDHVSTLHLRGEVTNLLSVMPMSFYYPAFLRGTAGERRVTVLPNDLPEVKALRVEVSKPYLKVSTQPYARGGKKGFEVVLEIAKDAPIGRVEERVVVKTDHPQQPVLRIPVFAAVHGKIVIFPERLQLFASEGGEKDPSIHLMRVAGEGGLPIESVEAPPQFQTEVTEVVPGKRAEVVLKLKPDAPRGPISGVVRIFLRDAEQPMFEVPVVGDVARRVSVDPAAVWLEGTDATALLRVSGGKVSGATAAPGAGAIACVLEEGGRVRVTLAKGAKPGPFATTISIKTDVPGEEQVDVPVHGVVAGR